MDMFESFYQGNRANSNLINQMYKFSVTGSSKEHEVNLNKEITKLKMELSAKILDLEQLEGSKKKQESAYKTLQEDISNVKEEYANKINEYESLLNEISQQNDKNKIDIQELQQSLAAKTKDYERLLAETSTSSSSTEKLINEYKETIHERDKEIIKLKDDYEHTTANFNIKHSKIAEEHKKEIEDRNTKIEQLIKEIESHKLALDQSKVDFDTLNSQFTINADELKALKEENERLKETVNDLTKANNELKAKISAMELEIGELKRQYDSTREKCEELQKAKDKVETEYLNLTGQATDSNAQFNQLSQHLKDTEKELQELKDKYRETANNHGRIEQEMKQKLFKLQEDFSLERGQLVRSVDEHIEKLKLTENKIKEFEMQVGEVSKKFKESEINNDKLHDENSNLKKEIDGLKLKEQELSTEYESIRKNLEANIDRYKEEISLLKAEGATSEVKLIEKVDQLTEAQNDLNNKLEEARKHEDSLQKIINDTTAQLNNQKMQFEKEIAQVQAQLSAVNEESNNYKLEETRLKELLEDKQNIVKDLSLKIEMLEVDVRSNIEMVNEKDRQIAQINEEFQKTSEGKKELEEKLNNAVQETASLKQMYEHLIANSSAEESNLKEQLNQLETLRVEMAVLVQDKATFEKKSNELSEELHKLKEEHYKTVEKLKENVSVSQDLNKNLLEKENLLKSQFEKTDADSNRIKQLEEEITQLKQVMLNKDLAIQEKESQLKKLNEALNLGTNETQQVITQLQSEIEQLNDKHKIEIESLNNTTKSLQSRVAEQENNVTELTQMKERVTELQALVTKSDKDIKQLTNINEGQKANYEDLNKQLQVQFDEYKKESKRAKHDLKAKLVEYDKELQESKEKIKVETEKQAELQEKLTAAEINVIDLSQKLELISVQQGTNAQKDDVLENLTLELQSLRKSSAESLANSETIIHTLKTDVEQKIKDLKQKDALITKLQDDLKVCICVLFIARFILYVRFGSV